VAVVVAIIIGKKKTDRLGILDVIVIAVVVFGIDADNVDVVFVFFLVSHAKAVIQSQVFGVMI
jgi:hypothetical protein